MGAVVLKDPLSMADFFQEGSAPPADVGALSRKLERFSPLGATERFELDELERESEWIPAGTPIVNQGAAFDTVIPIFEGLAYQHKDFRDGRRQIIMLLFPGDLCGDPRRAPHSATYGVRSLTRARIARIKPERFQNLLERYPAIARALGKSTLLEQELLRAWIVNLGQRHAHERIAHLMCELAQRTKDCGLALPNGDFELPMTQQELGAALGLTSVHINRILQQLRAEHLIEFHNGVLRINDFNRLQDIAGFNSTYLSTQA